MRYDKVQLRGKLWLHRVADKDDHRHRTGTDEGRMIYSESDESIYYGKTDDWEKVVSSQDVISTGTKFLMSRFPIPDSWNILTSNDDITVLVTDTSGEVGDTGGTWAIDSMTGSTGAHDHSGLTGKVASYTAHLGSSEISGTVQTHLHKHSIQSDGLHAHTFDGTWRPAHIKMCEVAYE